MKEKADFIASTFTATVSNAGYKHGTRVKFTMPSHRLSMWLNKNNIEVNIMEKNWKDIQHNIDREGGCKMEREVGKIIGVLISLDIHTA